VAPPPPELHDLATLPPERGAALNLPQSLHDLQTAPGLDQAASAARIESAPTRVRYFGDFEIVREIARGGMGVVFEARQMTLDRTVALKMILAGQLADDTDIKRFYTEAQAAAHLDHPGIVSIFEVGQHEGQHYFSMGFVAGQSASQRLAKGPLPAREAALMIRRVSEAIEYAHRRGVIHRDLKPANILLDADGNPRVTDFGLAKKVQGDSNLTGSGQIMGTPSFMPPEQAGGRHGEVGPAADVYALGATLYALLTGRPPFQAATPIDTVLQVLSNEPVAPRRLDPKLDRDLETICLKCLEKEPRRRYGSAREVADELARFLAGEPIMARPATRAERAVKWARRRPAIAALLGLVALVAALGLGGVLWQWKTALANAAAAKEQEKKAIVARNEAKDQEKRAILARNEAKDQEKRALVARDEAEQARGKEAEARKTSEEARGALKDEKERAEAKLYATSVALAYQEWSTGNVVRAESLLFGCPSRLRNWEWHYLNGLCHAELLTMRSLSLATIADFVGDGRTIVSADVKGVFKFWDLATGRIERTIASNTVAFALDRTGLRVAAVNLKQTDWIEVWDLASIAPPRVLKHVAPLPGLVGVAAFGPNGKFLALGAHDGRVHLWDIDRDAQARQPLQGQSEPVTALAYSADGRLLAVGKENGWAEIWEVETGRNRHAFRGHPARDAQVKKVAFSPDGKRLATASVDGTAKLWAVDDGRLLLTLWGHNGFLLCLAFSPEAGGWPLGVTTTPRGSGTL
jgi:hypothetical protein